MVAAVAGKVVLARRGRVDLGPLFAPEAELRQKILVSNPAQLFEFD